MFTFGTASRLSRDKLHPKLREIVDLAIREVDFKILDSTRGRKDQEIAFQGGKSKAHFGQSAHNYVPAIAMDLFPAPYDWNDTKSFDNLAKIVLRIAKEKAITLRWGGDWDMDGKKNTSGLVDLPHFELHPWRTWAERDSKLYEGK